MHRVLITEPLGTAADERLYRASDVIADIRLGLSYEDLLAIVSDYDAIIVRDQTRLNRDILEAAGKLRVIGHAGIGIGEIDVAAATRRGIVVMNTPDAQTIARAEFVMALILATGRQLPLAHAAVASGDWEPEAYIGMQLKDKVLGVIGFGRTGRMVAERARAFGMEVLACDKFVSEEVARARTVTLVELEDLLAESDFISMHVPATAETEMMIDAAALARMKDGVIFINASHGRLVDEQALAAALQSGKVRAAGLDVYREQPPDAAAGLLSLPNVIHTPRISTKTAEAEHEISLQVTDQVISALRGTSYPNAINLPYDLGGDFADALPYISLAEKLGRLLAGLADSPIKRIEIDVQGDVVVRLVRAIAAGVLSGALSSADERVNYINAPMLAHERGMTINRTIGINHLDYPNLVACRAHSDNGSHMVAGVLFGGSEPRIVQIDEYRLEAMPEGIVLIMLNRDVPGVIGQVGTILSAYEVNIGEWRLGRDRPGGEALSFINLDSRPGEATQRALGAIKAVTRVTLVDL